MKILYLVALATLLALFVFLCGSALCGAAGGEYVDADSAFVYAEGDSMILALGAGSYVLPAGEMPSGCYFLQPPEPGQRHGKALWGWWIC